MSANINTFQNLNHTLKPNIDNVVINVICETLDNIVKNKNYVTYEYWNIMEYISYIQGRAKCDEYSLMIAGILLRRFNASYPKAAGTNGSYHRLFLTSYILANKMYEDESYALDSWVKIGELFTLKELLKCEIEMLNFLDFDVIVQPEELLNVYTDCFQEASS